MPESRCQAAPELTGPSAMQGRHSPAPNAAILGLGEGIVWDCGRGFLFFAKGKDALGRRHD